MGVLHIFMSGRLEEFSANSFAKIAKYAVSNPKKMALLFFFMLILFGSGWTQLEVEKDSDKLWQNPNGRSYVFRKNYVEKHYEQSPSFFALNAIKKGHKEEAIKCFENEEYWPDTGDELPTQEDRSEGGAHTENWRFDLNEANMNMLWELNKIIETVKSKDGKPL